MSYFAVPLSGLIASQQQLQAVSNNLANLDTVGFKDQSVYLHRAAQRMEQAIRCRSGLA
jgi:flagellar basal body rod protein FlgG